MVSIVNETPYITRKKVKKLRVWVLGETLRLLIQVIFTTAEIVIGDCGGSWGGFTFDREMDHGTGFPELVVKESKSKGPRVELT